MRSAEGRYIDSSPANSSRAERHRRGHSSSRSEVSDVEMSDTSSFIDINDQMDPPTNDFRYPPPLARTRDLSPLPSMTSSSHHLPSFADPFPSSLSLVSSSTQFRGIEDPSIGQGSQSLQEELSKIDVNIIEDIMNEDDSEDDIPISPTVPNILPPNPPPSERRRVNLEGIDEAILRRRPHVIAHEPQYQDIWDRLPVGTLFELARLVSYHGIDLKGYTSKQLCALISSNKDGTRKLYEVLGLKEKLDPSDEVWTELDWEAERIIEGKGEMLGWRPEPGTRYGGKVQFSATIRLRGLENPSDRNRNWFAKPLNLEEDAYFDLDEPRTRGSCIFTRVFGSQRFFRAQFSPEIKQSMSPWRCSLEELQANREKISNWICRPIFIFGRLLVPFVDKEGVVVYFLEGRDRLGWIFDKGVTGYGIPECTTLKQLLDWWIPFGPNKEQSVSKLSSRLHLGLSDTLPGVFVNTNHVKVLPDISEYRKFY